MQVVPAITFLFILLAAPIWRTAGETLPIGESEELDSETGAVVRVIPAPNAWFRRCMVVLLGACFCIVTYTAPWVYWTKFLSLPGAL
jgi:hypothetical protein